MSIIKHNKKDKAYKLSFSSVISLFDAKMSGRLVVKSTDSTFTYPTNQPWDFRVRLPTPLSLEGYWTIELTEFYINNLTNKEIFVFCSLCDMSIVGGKEVPLLRRIYLQNEKNVIFTAPYQIPLRCADVTDIHIYIKDAQDKPASFLTDPPTLTLVFRRHPI